MDLQELKQYLESNKDNSDVQAVLNEFKTVSEEDVRSYLDTDEGKRFIQPTLDRYHNKSLQTWKDNNLQNLVEDEVAKRNPQETEEQKRIRLLEEQLENRDKAAARKDLETKALKLAQDKALPTEIVNFFVGEDEETTSANLDTLKQHLDATIQAQVDERFKAGGRDVIDGPGSSGTPTQSIMDMAAEANIRNK